MKLTRHVSITLVQAKFVLVHLLRVAAIWKFRIHFGVKLSNSTQPRYSPDTYLICLRKAQNEICSFGSKRFRELEPETPEARIFDKIAFAVGAGAAAIS